MWYRQRLPTDLETFLKLSFLVLYSKKKFLKTKLVNPFQLIKLSPKEKRGAAIVYKELIKTRLIYLGHLRTEEKGVYFSRFFHSNCKDSVGVVLDFSVNQEKLDVKICFDIPSTNYITLLFSLITNLAVRFFMVFDLFGLSVRFSAVRFSICSAFRIWPNVQVRNGLRYASGALFNFSPTSYTY